MDLGAEPPRINFVGYPSGHYPPNKSLSSENVVGKPVALFFE